MGTTVRRYDRGTLKAPKPTTNGGLRVDGYPSRVGIFEYRDGANGIRRELRAPEDVADPKSLATYDTAPLTLNHPPDFVTTKNKKQYSVGTVLEPARMDGDMVAMTSVVDSQDALDAIRNKTHEELSVGYTCDLDSTPGTHPTFGRYDARQRNIVVNHVALVPSGRAGRDARLRLDHDDAEMVREDDAMNAASRNALSADDFAVARTRSLPINDAAHVRAAMSRFGQTEFADAAEKKAAFHKIVTRAKSHGIDTKGFEETWSGRLDRLDSSSSTTTAAPPAPARQTMATKRTDEDFDNLQRQLAQAIARADKLDDDLKHWQGRAKEAEGSVTALTESRDKLLAGRIDQAEVDELKLALVEAGKKLETAEKARRDATAPAVIDEMVTKRFAIVKDVLDIDPDFRFEGMTNRQVMDHGLLKMTGKQPDRGEDDNFVAGQFKSSMEGHRAYSRALPKPRVDVTEDTDAEREDAAAKARERQQKRGLRPLPNDPRGNRSKEA